MKRGPVRTLIFRVDRTREDHSRGSLCVAGHSEANTLERGEIVSHMQAQFHELCVDVYTVYTVRDNLHQGRGGRATARRPQPQPGNKLGAWAYIPY